MLPLVPVDVSPALPELKQRAERLATGLHPGLRGWIERQAREEANHSFLDERRLRQAVARRFQSQTELSAPEEDSLAFLVLRAASEVIEQDVRAAMAIVVEADAAAQAAHATLKEFIETRALLKPPPPERAHLRVVPPVSQERLEELDRDAEAAAGRLQMINDRRSKVVAALFGLIKRLPADQSGLRRLA